MTAKAFRTLLIISVMLNVFLVGVIAGGAFMWLRAERPAPTLAADMRGGRLRIAGAGLSPEYRRAFRAALRETRRESRPLILESRAGRQEAARLLSQPVVNRAAVEAALARARAADIALRARLEERVIGFAVALPAEQRKVLAEGLEPRRMRRRER
ncbi:MAG: periplasmic heavy metal sensor [Pseudomonadota bacterium]|nr:periplasmic heavy metal sensor [Pseudomonadota bacterium]